MSGSLFSRVQKIVVATAESAVDLAERASSLSLMRKAIRDVETTIESHERTIADARRTQHLVAGTERAARAEILNLEEAARFALDKGREDLARAAVEQQLLLERELADQARARAAAEHRARAAAEAIGDATARLEQMRAELATLEQARARAAAEAGSPGAASAPDARLRAAEAVFERAAKAAGARQQAPAPGAEVEEIATLRDADEIAARLATLKARPEKPAPKRRAGRKATQKRAPRKA